MTQKYTIKPLEWKNGGSDKRKTWWCADTSFGYYMVSNNCGNWTWGYVFIEYHDELRNRHCESLEDGQRRAWENWLSRILPALEPTE